MKEAFKFLERVVKEPEQDEDGVATVTLSEAQWACKQAVLEVLERLVNMQPELMTGYVHQQLNFIKNKKNKISDVESQD